MGCKKMTELEKRANATIATQARFEGRPFSWEGQGTCAHLMRFHASNMGHNLPVVPRFRSSLGAQKAIKQMGHHNLIEVMDAYFDRIPVAFMRIGDIIAAPGSDGFEGLMVKGDKTKFLGWHEDAVGCSIIDVDVTQSVGAWRL